MNQYFLSISGQWWLLVALALVAIGFSIFAYTNTIPQIAKTKKILLISIRSIALCILLFALFEPIYTSIQSLFYKPKLAVLLDNSQSMAADDASGNREKRYRALINSIDWSKFDDNILFYQFTDECKQIPVLSDSTLPLNGNMTDISKAFQTVNSIAEVQNVRAMLLVSDGAFNVGNNPVFDAENFAKPIYTIGIGDTTDPKDLSITSILTNEIAYIDNPIPITINFTSVGYNAQEVKITLSDNGQRLSEQIFNVNSERTNYTAIFEYNPKVEGTRKLTATATTLSDEITDKNNTHSEYVKVLNNDRTIAIFGGSPSADLAFIKRTLADEPGVKIQEYVQKQGGAFYNNPTPQLLATADVIVLCGFPIASTPANVLQSIAGELAKGKSLLFIAGLNTDYNKLKTLDEYLPWTLISSKANEFSVSTMINTDALSNPVLRINGNDEDVDLWNKLPPIFRTETFVKVKPEAEVLSNMKVNNVVMKEPLLLTRDFQNMKCVSIMGYGLFRWKLLGYAAQTKWNNNSEVPDLFETLVDNSYRWLSVRDKNKQVNIRTVKKHYNQGEKVEFIGDIYDAAFVPMENANVRVSINSNDIKREITLTSIGNGRYHGIVDGLSKGDYPFTATATLGSRNLGNDDGRFSIGELAIEYQNLRQNSALLNTIAARTLGKYYDGTDLSTLIADITKNDSYTVRPVQKQSETLLWNAIPLLIAAILLFATEWFIRKRSGLL
ncbi:MAG: VWA domain-containing protein [Ignavibacteria bacterium]|jgi:hypothetical protein|nr:VWA domain-containing protein [Ignavibacteria bacterium]